MNRDCVFDSADAFRLDEQAERLQRTNEQIARLETELANSADNPRIVTTLEMRLERITEQRANLESFDAPMLSADAILGGMIVDSVCRDHGRAREVMVQSCEQAGRTDCACEGEAFADAWTSGEYQTNSQGYVKMNVIARTSCS